MEHTLPRGSPGLRGLAEGLGRAVGAVEGGAKGRLHGELGEALPQGAQVLGGAIPCQPWGGIELRI